MCIGGDTVHPCVGRVSPVAYRRPRMSNLRLGAIVSKALGLALGAIAASEEVVGPRRFPFAARCVFFFFAIAAAGFDTLASTRADPPATLGTAGSLQGVPPSCCGRRVRCGVACVRADHQGLEKRHWRRKQPANLAVEGAEESLSILPDYTPTVRPPPKRS